MPRPCTDPLAWGFREPLPLPVASLPSTFGYDLRPTIVAHAYYDSTRVLNTQEVRFDRAKALARFKALMVDAYPRGVIQKDLAGRWRLSQRAVSNYLAGVRLPELGLLAQILAELGVSPTWLLLGIEPKWLADLSLKDDDTGPSSEPPGSPALPPKLPRAPRSSGEKAVDEVALSKKRPSGRPSPPKNQRPPKAG